MALILSYLFAAMDSSCRQSWPIVGVSSPNRCLLPTINESSARSLSHGLEYRDLPSESDRRSDEGLRDARDRNSPATRSYRAPSATFDRVADSMHETYQIHG